MNTETTLGQLLRQRTTPTGQAATHENARAALASTRLAYEALADAALTIYNTGLHDQLLEHQIREACSAIARIERALQARGA